MTTKDIGPKKKKKVTPKVSNKVSPSIVKKETVKTFTKKKSSEEKKKASNSEEEKKKTSVKKEEKKKSSDTVVKTLSLRDKLKVKRSNAKGKIKRSLKSDAKDLDDAYKKRVRKEGGQPGNKNAEVWTESAAIELGLNIIEWMKAKPHNIHITEYLLIEKDYHCDLASDLAEKFMSFNALIGKAKEIKKANLLKYGQLGKLNPALVKFDLAINHDMIETNRMEHGGLGGGAINNKIEVEFISVGKTEEDSED